MQCQWRGRTIAFRGHRSMAHHCYFISIHGVAVFTQMGKRGYTKDTKAWRNPATNPKCTAFKSVLLATIKNSRPQVINNLLNTTTDERIFATFKYSKTRYYCQNCQCLCACETNIAPCTLPPLCPTGNEHEIVLLGCTSRSADWKVTPAQTTSSYNLEEVNWTCKKDFFFFFTFLSIKWRPYTAHSGSQWL